MNLVKLCGHTLDIDLLPDAPIILDVGCRGYGFGAELLTHRPDARIVCLDPDPDIAEPEDRRMTLCRVALAAESGKANYARFSTGDGNFIFDGALGYQHDFEIITVPKIDIGSLMKACDITRWDAVKLDCEGSEFEILERWPMRCATQISVEFHDYNQSGINDWYYGNLFSSALLDFGIVQHELSIQGTGCGHWDTLLVLRENYR